MTITTESIDRESHSVDLAPLAVSVPYGSECASSSQEDGGEGGVDAFRPACRAILSERIDEEQANRIRGGVPGERHLSFLGMVLHVLGIDPDDAHVVLGVNPASVARWCSPHPESMHPLPVDMLTRLETLRRELSGSTTNFTGLATAAILDHATKGRPAALDRLDGFDDSFLSHDMESVDVRRASDTSAILSRVDPDLSSALRSIGWLAMPSPFAALVRLGGLTRRDTADLISSTNELRCSVGDVRAMVRGKVVPHDEDYLALLKHCDQLFRMAHVILSYEYDAADAQETAIGWFLGVRTSEQCGRFVVSPS